MKLGRTLSIDGRKASAFICLGGCNVIRWKMSLFAGNADYGFFCLDLLPFWQRWGVSVLMVHVWASSNSVQKKKGFYTSLALPEPLWM